MNINNYTGMKYDFRKMNCWHYVRMVRADAGMETPEFDVLSPSGINDAFDSGHCDSKGLMQCYEPADFDAVLMGYRLGKRIVWHSGVYFKGMVSHCERMAKQVKLESLSDIRLKYTEIEFWR